jgi:hypothetical protein
MKSSLCLTIALGAGLVALPAIAAQMPKTASLTHEAAVIAVRGAMAQQSMHAEGKRTKAMGNNVFPGTPLANEFRAYPPSCAAWPLPDKASGQTATARVPLYTRNSAGSATTSETVTISIWRVPCSSSGNATPYNTDGGYNAMTFMRIDRDSANEGRLDVFPTFPLLQINQGSIGYSDLASLVRAASEPNTFIADGPFDAPVLNSTTYVLESYNTDADYLHYYNYAFKLLVDPVIPNVSPVEFTMPDYVPTQATYPAAFEPLPIDGYSSASWYDPAHNGEGMLTQIIDNDSTTRTFFAAWYTYDQLGLPYWLTIQGTMPHFQTDLTNVPVYYTSGGGFAGDFGSSVNLAGWGTMSVSFPDCMHMAFSFNGHTGTGDNGPGGSGSRIWTRAAGINALACE